MTSVLWAANFTHTCVRCAHARAHLCVFVSRAFMFCVGMRRSSSCAYALCAFLLCALCLINIIGVRLSHVFLSLLPVIVIIFYPSYVFAWSTSSESQALKTHTHFFLLTLFGFGSACALRFVVARCAYSKRHLMRRLFCFCFLYGFACLLWRRAFGHRVTCVFIAGCNVILYVVLPLLYDICCVAGQLRARFARQKYLCGRVCLALCVAYV